MNDIIIASMIRSERERILDGENRIEENRPIQSFLRGLFSRRTPRIDAPAKDAPKARAAKATHDCACISVNHG